MTSKSMSIPSDPAVIIALILAAAQIWTGRRVKEVRDTTKEVRQKLDDVHQEVNGARQAAEAAAMAAGEAKGYARALKERGEA